MCDHDQRPVAGAPTRPSREKLLPEWIGKDRKELVKAIGEPDLAVPTESRAQELCCSYQSHQYFFETDFKRDIKTAVQID